MHWLAMGAADLWKIQEDGVSVMSGALFRVTVPLPKNIRPGDYDVRFAYVMGS